jgi:nicotinamidase/pyrazinamidase
MTGLAIDPAADALLIMDVQNDFCPGGALAVPGGDAVVRPINQLLGRFRHVVLTQDWHPPGHVSFASAHRGRRPFETLDINGGLQTLWPDHCVQGSSGADFHADLDTAAAQLIVRKGTNPAVDSYSAFVENDRVTPTGLAGALRERGVPRVFLAGLALDFCVLWSAEDARRAGFEAVVVRDACRALDVHGSLAAALDRLGACGAQLVAAADLQHGQVQA